MQITTTKLEGSWKYRHEFTVQGKSRFPIDMLRYDACFPSRSEDAAAIGHYDVTSGPTCQHNEELIDVRLIRYSETKDPRITVGRWQSFGWSVVGSGVPI